MTQFQLAETLFVSPQTVSKWEAGSSEPDTEKLCSMADLFGISLDNLVRYDSTDVKKAFIAIDGGGTKTDFVLFGKQVHKLSKKYTAGCTTTKRNDTHCNYAESYRF